MYGFVSRVGALFATVCMFLFTFLLVPAANRLALLVSAVLGAIGLFVYCLLAGQDPLTLLEGVKQQAFEAGQMAGRRRAVEASRELTDICQTAKDGGQATINRVGELATEPAGQLSS